MRFKTYRIIYILFFMLCCLQQLRVAESYRTEVEITPAPTVDEVTTKKSGFFGGIKSFFRGSATTSTTTVPPPSTTKIATNAIPVQANADTSPKLPLVVKQPAPLMPLGPRPDTPISSPVAGNPQQPPQWPQVSSSTTTPASPNGRQQPAAAPANRPNVAQQPNLPPGFGTYHPPRQQPSGLDLSYGGAGAAGSAGANKNLPNGGRNTGFGLAPLHISSTTTAAPKLMQQPDPFNIDLRSGDIRTSTTTTTTTNRPQQIKDSPTLPLPRRPSTGAKEDFPALPAPRSPSPTPTSPSSPPSAWKTPLTSTTAAPLHPNVPGSPAAGTAASGSGNGNRVAFVPHTGGSTTTVRPGFASSGNSVATDDEIRTLTENLFSKETNSQLSLIRVSPQGKTRSIDSTDAAPEPLLQVDEKALEAPTIAKMRLLFNNYEVDTMVNEYVTPNERKEENDFLDAIMATSVMRQTMQFLQTKGLASADPKTHRDLVKELWFTQYSRGNGKIGSSGFEHVFVNEVKNGTLIGLHNWVYFYDEEKSGRLDYKGYMSQLDLGTKGKVLKVRFSHNGLNKPVNTLFVGTSPELELALYTLCFQLRPDRTCPVSLGNSKFGIVTYSWRYRGKNLIGSAYPEI